MSSFTLNLIVSGLVSVLVSAVSLYFLIPFLTKKAFLDIPNARSSHTKITPRGGGIAVVLGFLSGSFTAYLLNLPLPNITFFIGLILMAITSFADDKKSLPVLVRLSAHLFAMGLTIWYTGGLEKLPFAAPFDLELGIFGYIISAIWIISVINFFNFLDGIDGFAGSQAMLAGIALCTISWTDVPSAVALCIAMASLGFLFYNWHPAKIFMGDVGSISLGFAFATLPFYSQKLETEQSVFSTAIFLWFFLADGAFTLIRRILNKERIWEAHRTHLYQRLNKTGWAHDKTVSFIMALALILIAIQIGLVKKGLALNWYSVFIGALLFIVYTFIVFNKENKKS